MRERNNGAERLIENICGKLLEADVVFHFST